MPLRILHTSDWHIGRKLKEHDRAEEFRNFFAWLADVIARENVDALIVSGDIFDTRSPSAEAQEIYYSFLAEISGKKCRHVIITSGNHDSAAFIDAPGKIMSRLDINVVGRSCNDEIITLSDESGSPEMIVCAVPFLCEDDVMLFKTEDESADKSRKIRAAIMNHYAEIFSEALKVRGDSNIPIVTTGHLFLQRGKTQPDEGERSIYLGTAPNVGTDIFPDYIAYVALGHLHSPQKIGRPNIRYSGSPLAMSFGELGVTKTVSIVDFDGRNFAGVREIDIPVWQKMQRIYGDMAKIENDIKNLVSKNESVWAEVIYTGNEQPVDIQSRLSELVKDSAVEILSIKDESPRNNIPGVKGRPDSLITLNEMKPMEMLNLYFEKYGIPEEEQKIYRPLYIEILREMELDYAE